MNTLNVANLVGAATDAQGSGPTLPSNGLTGPDLSVEPKPVPIATVSLSCVEATVWDPTKAQWT